MEFVGRRNATTGMTLLPLAVPVLAPTSAWQGADLA
jgi:hypothetical protein